MGMAWVSYLGLGVPPAQSVNRAEGLGTTQLLGYYYLLQLLLQLLPTQQQRFICTMLKVDLMSERPRGVFIDIEIFYISIG